MKREIKFRAWSTGWKNEMSDWTTVVNNPIWFKALLNNEIPNTVLMQFTGLKDKNGNEIYEGDIRRHINHYEGKKPYYAYHKIVWDESFAAWKCVHLDNADESLIVNGNCLLSVYLKYESEQFGNIYENSELLTPMNHLDYKPKTRNGITRKIEVVKKTIESAKTIKNAILRTESLRRRKRELVKLEDQLNEFGLKRRGITL